MMQHHLIHHRLIHYHLNLNQMNPIMIHPKKYLFILMERDLLLNLTLEKNVLVQIPTEEFLLHPILQLKGLLEFITI